MKELSSIVDEMTVAIAKDVASAGSKYLMFFTVALKSLFNLYLLTYMK
jgi:hypothetical protein